MHPFAGTPFAFWMTSMMCWSNFIDAQLLHTVRPANRYGRDAD